MKGTRRGVLQQLEDWMHNEQGGRLLWLSGFAGTGKSTIAQTFAEICFADGVLGASFFCSRGSQGRNDVQLIFPTLAFQLARRYPKFREELLKVMRENPNVGQGSLESQVEELIVGPFEVTQIQTLIIIDALDECDSRGQGSIGMFLSSLSDHMDGIPNVKFLITGRPVDAIEDAIDEMLETRVEWLTLENVGRSLVNDDIKLFLRYFLRDHAKARGYHVRDDWNWPSSQDINRLCDQARGRFTDALTLASQFGNTIPVRTTVWTGLAWDSGLILLLFV